MSRPVKLAPNAIAYSYLRFSSPEQAKGDSVRRQTEMTETWCARNDVKYDASLSLRDEGISAFTGEHRKNPDRHALAGFLELVRQGKIAKGSLLIIENLDRLTREDTVPAVNLFTGILLSGVHIVQLDPETIYTDKSDSMDVMRAVLEMSRGHSESKNKSRRMSEVWGEKRKRARESGAVISRSCPAWLKVEGTGATAKYALVPVRAEAVRRVFRMTIEGHGVRMILKTFAEEKVPPLARKPWSASYVKAILNSRATFGEFTPRERGKGGGTLQRKPVAPPIANYYPAVIDADTFFAAQAATKSRKGKAGRPSKERVNVFAGLIWDARTQSRMHVNLYSRNGVRVPYLVPYDAVEQRAEHVSFPLAVFEGALFDYLIGIDPREVLPAGDSSATDILALAGRLTDIEGRITNIKARLRVENEVDALIDTVRDLERERKAATDALTAARQKAASPLGEAWGEFKSIAEALARVPDLSEARLKLRGALRRMVDSVWCLFVPGRGPRLGYVQVHFTGGTRWRIS